MEGGDERGLESTLSVRSPAWWTGTPGGERRDQERARSSINLPTAVGGYAGWQQRRCACWWPPDRLTGSLRLLAGHVRRSSASAPQLAGVGIPPSGFSEPAFLQHHATEAGGPRDEWVASFPLRGRAVYARGHYRRPGCHACGIGTPANPWNGKHPFSVLQIGSTPLLHLSGSSYRNQENVRERSEHRRGLYWFHDARESLVAAAGGSYRVRPDD